VDHHRSLVRIIAVRYLKSLRVTIADNHRPPKLFFSQPYSGEAQQRRRRETMSEPKDPLYIASLEKGLRVLDAFASGHQFMSLTEIADYCGIGKSSAQRLTHTL